MRRMMLIAVAAAAAGCTKSTTYFFDADLIEHQPDGKTVTIPVLLEREYIPSQDKIVETNHQVTNGTNRHFSVVHDFKSGALEMRENGRILSQGTIVCQREGVALETITSCTYDLTTTRGDKIRGTDTYEGTEKISFNTVLTPGNGQGEFSYSGGAHSVAKDQFNSLFSQRFPASGAGCNVGSVSSQPESAGLLTAAIFFAVRFVGRCRKHHLR